MDNFLILATGWPLGLISAPICIMIFWWLLSAIGLFDFDLDFDIESISGPLVWANFNEVPLKVGLTVWLLTAWVVAVLFKFTVSPLISFDDDNIFKMIVEGSYIILSFGIALVPTKYICLKLSPAFQIQQGMSSSDIVGKEGVVISSTITDTYGEIDVFAENGFRVRVSAISFSSELFKKGDKVIVADIDDKNKAIVAKFNF